MSSVQQTDEIETYGCVECDTEYDAGDAVRGSFCSWDCYYRKKGRSALHQIKHDHRLCSTCFRAIKTVLEPEERHPDCVKGWQFATENTVHAVDEFWRDEIATLADDEDQHAPNREDFDVRQSDRLERTRWSCKCGAVDSSHRYEELEDIDRGERLTSAAITLARLSSEDSVGGTFDRERFKKAARDQWPDIDWEFVFGYTLYGPYRSRDHEDADPDAFLDHDD